MNSPAKENLQGIQHTLIKWARNGKITAEWGKHRIWRVNRGSLATLWDFGVLEGTKPDGERVPVLRRNFDETDNDALDKWFAKQDYNTKEPVCDLFYVNGDNHLENLRRIDQTWKVRLIEEEFQRLMFDVEDA